MEKKLFITTILLTACFSAAAWAQDEDRNDTDPFYPSAKRPAVAAPSQQDSDWGRDPFTSPFAHRVPSQQNTLPRASGGNLTGVIYSKQARVAIIGGEVFREGSMVGDKRLVDIRRRSVVLMNKAGGQEEIFLEDFSLGGK